MIGLEKSFWMIYSNTHLRTRETLPLSIGLYIFPSLWMPDFNPQLQNGSQTETGTLYYLHTWWCLGWSSRCRGSRSSRRPPAPGSPGTRTRSSRSSQTSPHSSAPGSLKKNHVRGGGFKRFWKAHKKGGSGQMSFFSKFLTITWRKAGWGPWKLWKLSFHDLWTLKKQVLLFYKIWKK